MKKTKILFLALFFVTGVFCFAKASEAADHYICSDASGGNNGSDWANAWHDFDHAIWTRGDTYYIAAGTYTTPTLNRALSGTTYIYIKSATESSHGIDTGWNASYAGQAIWNGQLNIDTGYWDIDGKYGSGEGNNPGLGTAYGIKVVPVCPVKAPTDDCTSAESTKGIMLANNTNQKDGVNLSYIDATSCGEDHGGCNDDGMMLGHVTNSTFNHLYLHDNNRVAIGFVGGCTGNILQNSIFARRHASHEGTPHGELLSCADGGNNDNIIRWSKFYDGQGTGTVVIQNGINTDWDIYGNLFYTTAGNESRYNVSNGVITNGSGDTTNNVLIYNNTFYNIHNISGGHALPVGFPGSASGVVISNNIFWDTANIGPNVETRSYNLWNNSTYAAADSNGQYFSGSISDLFNDYSNNNFSLKNATTTGTILSSPYDQDILGNTFGFDGTWDRGAYEYVSGSSDATSPIAPSGLSVN